MLRCIAIDDEPLALQLLVDDISKVPYLKLVASCEDAFAATKALQENEVDLIFIDIQMPGLTGLQFLGSLTQKPMAIIITAYKQYALEGYSLDVVDYLLKPVSIERFIKACNKALELYTLKHKNPFSVNVSDYMFVNVGYSMRKVMFNDIIYVEGLRDYIKINLKSTPKSVVVRMGIKALAEQLPAAAFLQINKSYIVAVDSITSIRKTSVFIDELELFIGNSYKESVRNFIKGRIK